MKILSGVLASLCVMLLGIILMLCSKLEKQAPTPSIYKFKENEIQKGTYFVIEKRWYAPIEVQEIKINGNQHYFVVKWGYSVTAIPVNKEKE